VKCGLLGELAVQHVEEDIKPDTENATPQNKKE